MTIDELRLVHEAQPFQPFTMYMPTGVSFMCRIKSFYLAIQRGGP
jgi:hypothetical protein